MKLTVKSANAGGLIGAALLVSLSVPPDAAAQTAAPPSPAAAEAADDYSAVGIRAGAFKILPKVETKETYNSNIYAASTNEKVDYITTVSPDIAINSDFSNHALNFFAGSDVNLYSHHEDEDYNDYRVGTTFRVDVLRETNLTGGASYKILHEDRGSPDSPSNAKEPTEYSLTNVNVGAKHKINRVGLSLNGARDTYNFDDVTNLNGSITDQDGRDRNKDTLVGKVSYELMPSYEAFVRGTLNKVDYDLSRDSNGLSRDSEGYEAVAGVSIDLTRLLRGDIYAGYMSQDSTDRRLETIDGYVAGVSLTWTPTALLTVTPSVTRSIEETTNASYAGYVSTNFGLKLEHQLRRNLLLNIYGKYGMSEYHRSSTFTGAEREETTYEVGLGAKYSLSRMAYVGMSYSYYTKSVDNVTNADYDQQKAILTLGLQY